MLSAISLVIEQRKNEFDRIDNINILPLVEGVMVDYHTREKYHTLEKEYHPRRS
jgi:hypothetical protein